MTLTHFFADMTFESADTCMKILELLCAKMEDPSAIVKHKALNVVKQVLQKGSTAFSREMGRKQAVIRDCMNFRGPPDPLRGDAPYAQVRELAQQVINMIYDTEVTTQTPPPFALNTTFPPAASNPGNFSESGRNFSGPTALGSSIEPGSAASSAQPSSNYKVSTTVNGGGDRRVYVQTPKAIGSYIEHQPSRFESMMDAVSEGLETFKASVTGNQPAKSANGNGPARNIYSAGTSTGGRNLGFEPRYTTGDVSSLDYDGDRDGEMRFTPSSTNSSVSESAGLSVELVGLSRSVRTILDSLEYRAVNDITLNGGKRTVLSRTETSAFVTKVRNSGDSRPLIECLLVRIFLVDINWLPTVNALGLLDSILKNQISGASLVVQPHVAALSQLASRSVQSAIQEKIKSILQHFPDEVRQLSISQQSSTASTSHQDSSEDSIFSGLQTESESHSQLIESDDFSFLGAPSKIVVPSSSSPAINLIDDGPHFADGASNSNDSLFEGLTIDSSSHPSSSAAPPSHHSSTQTDHSLLDFLDNPSVPSNRQASSTASGNGLSSDFSSLLAMRPTASSTSNPTATLGQPQMTSTFVQTNTATTAENQIAILRGQRAAILDQLELLRLQTMTAQRSEVENTMLAQVKAIDTSLADLERTTKTSTFTGPSASLESIYRQQPISSGPQIDYSALQTSHPVDPFDSIRHDMKM